MTDTWTIGEDLPLPEEGEYEAESLSVEDEPPKPPFNKDQLRITFKVWLDEGAIELAKWVNKPEGGVLRPKHGLYSLAEALLGITLNEHGALTRDDLVNRRCRVILQHYTKEDGTQAIKISNVLRAKKAVRSAEPSEIPPEVEPEDLPFEA